MHCRLAVEFHRLCLLEQTACIRIRTKVYAAELHFCLSGSYWFLGTRPRYGSILNVYKICNATGAVLTSYFYWDGFGLANISNTITLKNLFHGILMYRLLIENIVLFVHAVVWFGGAGWRQWALNGWVWPRGPRRCCFGESCACCWRTRPGGQPARTTAHPDQIDKYENHFTSDGGFRPWAPLLLALSLWHLKPVLYAWTFVVSPTLWICLVGPKEEILHSGW